MEFVPNGLLLKCFRCFGGAQMDFESLICWLDRHSGLISAVGLLLAAIGLILTLIYLILYSSQLKSESDERRRLSWERILKLLHEVAKWSAAANLSSVNHSPLIQQLGVLPPQIAANYGTASETLLSYWLQLKLELDLMPPSEIIENVRTFIQQYDASADQRASGQFGEDLLPLTEAVRPLAQRPRIG
jgi:hypothetical protein